MHRVTNKRTGGAATAALLVLLALCGLPLRSLHAQDPAPAAEVGIVVDSVSIRGASRVQEATVRSTAAIRPGQTLTAPDVQRVIRRLMSTGNYESVEVFVRPGAERRGTVVVQVAERPFITNIAFEGLRSLNGRTVRDSAKLRENAPLDPQRVAVARKLVRDLLAKRGVQLAAVDTALTPEGTAGSYRLTFKVREGGRLAIADVDFTGNAAFSDDDLRDAMATKPEGFLWFRTGRFDREVLDEDLAAALPRFYGSHGYIDFAVVGDTLVVDPETGKARLVIEVAEGPQYRLGNLRIEGNARFPTEEMMRLFTVQNRSVLGLPFGGQGRREAGEVFDRGALDAAVDQVEQLYRNEGYLYAQLAPVVERVPAAEPGASPTVDVTVAVSERSPFYIRRISFAGNSTTHENVIRERLWILPGDVYNEERVIQSFQAISGLGFFETPLSQPDISPDPEAGTVDITFHVKEKQTGNINFGTVIGGGYGGRAGGFSGFLGYSQPNLFGQGKSASLRAEYGPGRRTFEASYSDPALLGTRNSGSFSVFHSGDRYATFGNIRRTRTGGSAQIGFPVPGLIRTRAFLGYSLSRTAYENNSGTECDDEGSIACLPDATASNLSLSVTRDTKNHPLFPTSGTRQSLSVEQTGGPLGGTGNFQKASSELEWWVPTGKLGSGPRPIRFALGLQARAGGIFGDASPFPFERFFAGGTQFGQPLRGYSEATISALGYSEACGRSLALPCLGDSYLTLTAEHAFRVNDNLSLSLFGDAGSVWSDVGHIDPTRLYRSAGVGATVVTPFLGAIGIDAAYGFDSPTPKWEIHFKLGNSF